MFFRTGKKTCIYFSLFTFCLIKMSEICFQQTAKCTLTILFPQGVADTPHAKTRFFSSYVSHEGFTWGVHTSLKGGSHEEFTHPIMVVHRRRLHIPEKWFIRASEHRTLKCSRSEYEHVSLTHWAVQIMADVNCFDTTQGNYATVGSAIVAIAIVGRGGWAGLLSTVAI